MKNLFFKVAPHFFFIATLGVGILIGYRLGEEEGMIFASFPASIVACLVLVKLIQWTNESTSDED